MKKNVSSNTKNFPECSSGHLEGSVKNCGPKFSHIDQNIFRPMPENEKKNTTSSSKWSTFLKTSAGIHKCSFWERPRKFTANFKKFLLDVQK